MHEKDRIKTQALEMRDSEGLDKIPGEDDRKTWHTTGPRCGRSGADLEVAKKLTSADELYWFRQIL